jgi:hypothetical protein
MEILNSRDKVNVIVMRMIEGSLMSNVEELIALAQPRACDGRHEI